MSLEYSRVFNLDRRGAFASDPSVLLTPSPAGTV